MRNLHIDTQESTIAEVFQGIAPVERVKKIRDYAFVHFTSKEDARKAKKAIDGTKIDGCDVEVGEKVFFVRIKSTCASMLHYIKGSRYNFSKASPQIYCSTWVVPI